MAATPDPVETSGPACQHEGFAIRTAALPIGPDPLEVVGTTTDCLPSDRDCRSRHQPRFDYRFPSVQQTHWCRSPAPKPDRSDRRLVPSGPRYRRNAIVWQCLVPVRRKICKRGIQESTITVDSPPAVASAYMVSARAIWSWDPHLHPVHAHPCLGRFLHEGLDRAGHRRRHGLDPGARWHQVTRTRTGSDNRGQVPGPAGGTPSNCCRAN